MFLILFRGGVPFADRGVYMGIRCLLAGWGELMTSTGPRPGCLEHHRHCHGDYNLNCLLLSSCGPALEHASILAIVTLSSPVRRCRHLAQPLNIYIYIYIYVYLCGCCEYDPKAARPLLLRIPDPIEEPSSYDLGSLNP